MEGIQKGILSVKNGMWKGKGLNPGAEPPQRNQWWVPFQGSNITEPHFFYFKKKK